MKKLVIVAFALVFVCSLFVGSITAKKIGETKDGIFTDTDNLFSFAIPDGWSEKIGSKSKVPLRMTLTQKSYAVPRDFQGGNEDYAQIPTIKVLVDTCTATLEEFTARMTDDKFESDQKKYFLKHLKIISKPHEIMTSSDVTVQGVQARIISARQAYTLEVAQRGSDRADVVNEYKLGSIFITIREGKVYLVHLITEYQTAAAYEKMFSELLSSLKFDVEAKK